MILLQHLIWPCLPTLNKNIPYLSNYKSIFCSQGSLDNPTNVKGYRSRLCLGSSFFWWNHTCLYFKVLVKLLSCWWVKFLFKICAKINGIRNCPKFLLPQWKTLIQLFKIPAVCVFIFYFFMIHSNRIVNCIGNIVLQYWYLTDIFKITGTSIASMPACWGLALMRTKMRKTWLKLPWCWRQERKSSGLNSTPSLTFSLTLLEEHPMRDTNATRWVPCDSPELSPFYLYCYDRKSLYLTILFLIYR